MEESNDKIIEELKAENAYLKYLLDQAKISYRIEETSENFDDAPVKMPYITDQLANKFASYFWGRKDVYAARFENRKTGKSGYYPQCSNFWQPGCFRKTGVKTHCKECPLRNWKSLTLDVYKRHLLGRREDHRDVLGVYPIDGGCTRFLVFDFDDHEAGVDNSWKQEVNLLTDVLAKLGIDYLLERSRSGNGAHIWIFFKDPVAACTAREFGQSLLDRGMQLTSSFSFSYYDRMIPAQDQVDQDGLGTLIALPLQGWAVKNNNSVFVDSQWHAYPDQFGTLFRCRKLALEEVETFIEEWKREKFKNLSQVPFPFDENEDKPWLKSGRLHKEDIAGSLEITLRDGLYIPKANLMPRLQNQLRQLAAFRNPRHLKNSWLNLSNHKEPMWMYYGIDHKNYIVLPRGILDTIEKLAREAGIEVKKRDERGMGKRIQVEFTGQLREEQKKAVDEMAGCTAGILESATGSGKTVMGAALIARKKVSALILVEKTELVQQWQSTFEKFLRLKEELPEYQTRSGNTRRRKSHIGLMQSSKNTTGGLIDIAMIQTLIRKENLPAFLNQYGMILFDECHRAASDTAVQILKQVSAKYVYGLTATPIRTDDMEKAMHFYLGPVRSRFTAQQQSALNQMEHLVYPRFTSFVMPAARGKKMGFHEVTERLIENKARNQMIAADIVQAVELKRTPLVLSRYKKHIQILTDLVQGKADHIFVLDGSISRKERKELIEKAKNLPDSESFIFLATEQIAGEGFDFPRLDTLFMTVPISSELNVTQNSGRIGRFYKEKAVTIIYDYVDHHVAMLQRMYRKRLKAYANIGYAMTEDPARPLDRRDIIYNADNFKSVYTEDLKNAGKEIILSSLSIYSDTASRFLKLVHPLLEKGVKICVVIPESESVSESEGKDLWMSRFWQAGIEVMKTRKYIEQFTIIDESIAWYGSVPFLGKPDAEDVITRLVCQDAIAQLMEMTFGKKKKLAAYEQIPLEME